jgi:hypothetical protein
MTSCDATASLTTSYDLTDAVPDALPSTTVTMVQQPLPAQPAIPDSSYPTGPGKKTGRSLKQPRPQTAPEREEVELLPSTSTVAQTLTVSYVIIPLISIARRSLF